MLPTLKGVLYYSERFTREHRLKVVKMCLSGDYSYTEVAKKFNTVDSTSLT